MIRAHPPPCLHNNKLYNHYSHEPCIGHSVQRACIQARVVRQYSYEAIIGVGKLS